MNVLQLSLVLFVIALCNSLVQSAVVTSESGELNLMDFNLCIEIYLRVVDCILSEEYGVFTYPPTRECSLAGGICVHDADCLPGETTSQKNLCKAHGDDIQCCYARE